MSGEFFETWVVTEVYKSYINAGKRPPLYFYRDSNKREIDLIIQQGGTVYPVEIKKSASPHNATRNFGALKPVAGGPRQELVGPGAVVCLASDVLPIDKNNWLVPAWLI